MPVDYSSGSGSRSGMAIYTGMDAGEAAAGVESLNVQSNGFWGDAARYAGSVLPNLVDTVSSSLGITDKGEINNFITSGLGLPGYQQWIDQNQEGVDLATGAAALVLDVIGVGKLGAAIQAGRVGSRIPGMTKVAQLNQRFRDATQAVKDTDLALMRAGFDDKEVLEFVGNLGGLAVNRPALASKAKWLGQADTALSSLAVEGIFALTQNENQFFFPDGENTMIIANAAIGVALPGLANWLQVGHQFKKFANSDTARKAANSFYDPAQIDEAMELTSGAFPATRSATNDLVKDALKRVEITTPSFFADQATAFFLQRDSRRALRDNLALSPAGTNGRSSIQAEKLANEAENAGFNYLERAARIGLGLAGTKLGDDVAAANTMRFATRQDPAAFYGAEYVGVVPQGRSGAETVTAFAERAQAKIETLDKDILIAKNSKKLTAEAKGKKLNVFYAARRNAVAESELVPHEWYNGQWVDPADLAKIGGTPQVGKIKFSQPDPKTAIYEVLDARGNPTNIGIDTTGVAYLPISSEGVKRTFNTLTHAETLGWFRAANQLVQHTVETGKVFKIPANASWQVIDTALEIERQAARPGLVDWGTHMTKERAAVNSFQLKAMQLPAFARKNPGIPDFLLAERFNLPAMTTYEASIASGTSSNVARVMRGMTDPQEIAGYTEAQLIEGFNAGRFAENLFDNAQKGIKSLSGGTFHAGLDDAGGQLAPVLAMKRSINAGFFTRDSLELRMAMGHAQRLAALQHGGDSPMVKAIAQTFISDADVITASNVKGLHPIQRQATTPGFGKRVATTTAQYATFLDRDNPIMLAASRLGLKARKLGEAAYDVAFSPIAPVFAKLRTNDSIASRFQLEQFIVAREGWEIAGKGAKVARPEGKIAFMLEPTQANKDAWFNRYGTQMPESATMHDHLGKEIQLDASADEALKHLVSSFDNVRNERNAVLRSQGLPEIKQSPYYIPPREQVNKFIEFVQDANNDVRFRLQADSEKQLAALKAEIYRDPRHPANQPGWKIRPRESIESFENDIWNRKAFDFEDPSIPVVAAGKERTGSGLNPLHEFGATERVLTQLQTQYVSLAKDVLQSIMQPALSGAQMRASALRKSVANVGDGGAARKITTESRSIHDDYQNYVLGRNPLYSKGSPISSTYQALAGLGDKASAWLGQAAFTPAQKFKAMTPGLMSARQEFEELARSMGNQIPFQDVDAYVANRFGTKRLMDSTEVTGKIAFFTSTMTLRLFETGQALMNMAGILAMSPAVIRGLTPRAGESIEETSARLGMDAMIFPRQGGQHITALDMPRLIAGGMRDAFSGAKHADWARKAAKGQLTQEVAEFHRHLSQQHGRADWTQYINGSPSGKTFMEKNGVVGAASMLADKSENFSRAWANFVGDRVARRIGFTDVQLIDNYAHDFANKLIADYNPTNRPEIFQGPVGNTIGLFQSYIFNYYGNLFRGIETRDSARLMAQMLGQSMFFGAQTIPGFSEYNSMIVAMSKGDENPMDRMNQVIPRGVSDVIMSGVPSSFPQLFGFGPGTGLALTARGDTTVRLPGVSGLPAYAVASKVAGGIGEMVDIFTGENPKITPMQITEALSHMFGSARPISAMIANFGAEGQTDRTGQLVGENLTAFKAIVNMTGLKTLEDQKMTEAFYATRGEQELQRIKRQQLVARSRTLMRDGDYDALPDVYNSYLSTGGDPRRFNSWISALNESATTSRSQRQLRETLDDPRKMDQTMRMLDAMGGSDSTEGPDAP